MPAQVKSRAANFAAADTEQVTVLRRSQSGTNALGEPTFSTTTLYSGKADYQEPKGGLLFGRAGLAEGADAMLLIEKAPLPAILPGDKVLFGSEALLVVHVYFYAFPYGHLEALLQRGKAW